MLQTETYLTIVIYDRKTFMVQATSIHKVIYELLESLFSSGYLSQDKTFVLKLLVRSPLQGL